MFDLFGRFLLENLFLIGQMAPYLTLGFVFAGLLHAFVPKQAGEFRLYEGPVRPLERDNGVD